MKKQKKNKDKIVEKAVEKDKEFMEMAVDIITDYFEENPEGCSSGKLCPEAVSAECKGMPFITETRIKQVLDIMYHEDYLEREIPEGTGTPHYSLK